MVTYVKMCKMKILLVFFMQNNLAPYLNSDSIVNIFPNPIITWSRKYASSLHTDTEITTWLQKSSYEICYAYPRPTKLLITDCKQKTLWPTNICF